MARLSPNEYEEVQIATPLGAIVGRWYGVRQQRPILALHGWLDNLGTWEPLIAYLPSNLSILSIDIPGHGHSYHLPSGVLYSLDDLQTLILTVIKEYKWDRVSLMGHSLGASLIHWYAAINPHYVDMIINLDLIKLPSYNPKAAIKNIVVFTEKYIKLDERIQKQSSNEPSAYTYEQLEEMYKTMYKITGDMAKHLINNGAVKSKIHPNKYYLSGDERLKALRPSYATPSEMATLTRRIRNIPYLLIKGTDSNFIGKDSKELIDILRAQNKYFEYHEVKGNHHVHMERPAECANLIVSFINNWQTAVPNSWALDESVELMEPEDTKRGRLQLFHKNEQTRVKSRL